MDDNLRRKYINLKERLRVISSDISELNNKLGNLNSYAYDNIRINKKLPISKLLDESKSKARSAREDILENVIPRINDKIYRD